MTHLPWQQTQWLALNERIAQNKIPHAMLFQGPQGIGKMQFAAAFVKRLFCTAPTNQHACGQCDSCHLLSVHNHPDLAVIRCDDDKKNISVDQIRRLVDYAVLSPHSAKYKVAIIHQAEQMSVSAANSILKTLEEPPKSVLIILLTHKPEQLLPTILSRCQNVFFTLPPLEMADQWLAAQVTDSARRQALLALANGAPLKSLEYESEGVIEQRQMQFETLLELLSRKQDPVSAASLWLKFDLELSLNCIISWVIDVARLKVSQQAPIITNSDLQQDLLNLAANANLQQILEYQQFLYECLVWSRSNINTQLLLEDILIRWIRLFR